MRVLVGSVFLLAILGVPCLVRAGIAAMFEQWPPCPPAAPTRPAVLRSGGPDLSGRAVTMTMLGSSRLSGRSFRRVR